MTGADPLTRLDPVSAKFHPTKLSEQFFFKSPHISVHIYASRRHIDLNRTPCESKLAGPSKHADVGPTSADVGVTSATRHRHADVGPTSVQPRHDVGWMSDMPACSDVQPRSSRRRADVGPRSIAEVQPTSGRRRGDVGPTSAAVLTVKII